MKNKARKKRKIILLIIPGIILLAFIGSGIFAGIFTLTNSYKEPTTFYHSIEELAIEWGETYKNSEKEYCAIIISKKQDGQKVYFLKRTYTGSSESVRSGFFSGYFNCGLSCLLSNSRMEGWIHTHPFKNPPLGEGINTSDSDMFCLYLPGIRAGYIVFPSGEVIQYDKNWDERSLNKEDLNKRG